MGECFFTYIDRSGEDWLHCVDIRLDGAICFMNPGNIRDPPQVPAGIFLPTIAIGAAFGRAVGLLTYKLILLSESFGLTVLQPGSVSGLP